MIAGLGVSKKWAAGSSKQTSFIIHYLDRQPKEVRVANKMATIPPCGFPTSSTPWSRAPNRLFGSFGGAKGILQALIAIANTLRGYPFLAKTALPTSNRQIGPL